MASKRVMGTKSIMTSKQVMGTLVVATPMIVVVKTYVVT